MTAIDRRQLMGGLVLASSAMSAAAIGRFAAPAIAGAKAKIVVVGGGPGGATAAKYLAKEAGGALDVTLVEPAERYTTCFHSNLYLGGMKSFEEITFGYDKLPGYGVRHVRQMASAVDRDKRSVALADGATLTYDRLVLSPGIDLKYDSVPGWGKEHEQTCPHAWKAGPQTELLKARLDALKDGDTIVVISPPNPYRCPPGPYERVSVMAHVLKATGRGNCKIFILDAKDKFSKQALFQEGWEKYYQGLIEWLPPSIHDGIKHVDPATGTVETGFETYKAALINVIPAQTAGRIAVQAGLANETGYCPIDPASLRSTSDHNVFVLGDACIGGDMPRSAYAANNQAKRVASVLRGELLGATVPPPRYENTCWSFIETDDTVKIGGSYAPKDGRITEVEGFVSHPGEPDSLRQQGYGENLGWYANITADIFD